MPQVVIAGRSIEHQWIEGAEPTLVFLHEGLGSIRLWRDFPARVARATGRRALVFDRYGYGDSDVLAEPRVPLRFMHDEALRFLPEFLPALGIANPVLVGHSDGASIALIYAGAGHPVRGVAVMAPHVFVEEVCVRSIEKARRQFAAGELARRLAKYHRDPRKTFHLWSDAWLDPDFLEWNIEEYLPGIRCPLLAIQGEDDAYGTMAQLDAIERQAGGKCRLAKLPRCGHAPHRDQPERTLAAIVEFVHELGG